MESLLAVDDAVKRIVGRLTKAGDLRKTYIFFTSDNGLQLGSHRLLFKAFLYEESTRVPLIIRGPRFPAGAVRRAAVSNVDLAPTIVELTKARPGLTMDGRSLLPLAADASLGAGREMLFESYQTTSFGLRRGNFVYISHDTGEEELYDLVGRPVRAREPARERAAPRAEGGAGGAAGPAPDLLSALGCAPRSSSFCCIASASALTPLIGRT